MGDALLGISLILVSTGVQQKISCRLLAFQKWLNFAEHHAEHRRMQVQKTPEITAFAGFRPLLSGNNLLLKNQYKYPLKPLQIGGFGGFRHVWGIDFAEHLLYI